MARPKIDDPKKPLGVRANSENINFLKMLGSGSVQKGLDRLLEFASHEIDLVEAYIDYKKRQGLDRKE
jgi:hypothetical protein